MDGFIGEFFGTAILILLGAGTGAGINLNKTYAKGSGWLFVCLSWGMAVTMGVYVAGLLGSDGHLNPAVTIPFAIFGLFPWNEVLPYLAGQFLGAFCGAAIVMVALGHTLKKPKGKRMGTLLGYLLRCQQLSHHFSTSSQKLSQHLRLSLFFLT